MIPPPIMMCSTLWIRYKDGTGREGLDSGGAGGTQVKQYRLDTRDVIGFTVLHRLNYRPPRVV